MHQSERSPGQRRIAIDDCLMLRIRTILVGTVVLNGLCSCPLRADTTPSGKTKTKVTSEDVLTDFDSVAARAMKEWNIPGMAVCVVHDGKVVLSKGYGYSDIEQQVPVTNKTLFGIGSLTKSFTVVGLGMLADEGQLDWDKPVRHYLPGFQMHERVPTERVTPRDLVTHQTGMPHHQISFTGVDGWPQTIDRQEMLQRLRFLKPSSDLRARYEYTNLMYMVAGMVAERISGKSWEQFTKERVFDPLGMKDSIAVPISDLQKHPSAAIPYLFRDGRVHSASRLQGDVLAPAGNVVSCADDMSRYLLFLINEGRHRKQRLLSRQQAEMMITRSVELPDSGFYGMGVNIARLSGGRKFIFHSGGVHGYTAFMGYIPSERSGFVILTNLNYNYYLAPQAVGFHLVDRILNINASVDRIKKFRVKQRAEDEYGRTYWKKRLPVRKPNTKPSHTAADYAGTYRNGGYGSFIVEVEEDQMRWSFHGWTGTLKHYHYDVFEMLLDSRHENSLKLPVKLVLFEHNRAGDISQLSITMLEASAGDVAFKRTHLASDE